MSASATDRAPRQVAGALAALALLWGCSSGGEAQLGLGPPPTLALTAPTTTTVAVDPSIVDLLDGAGMTEASRALFLAARPQIEDVATLAESCAGVAAAEPASTHTYGCVVDGRIHLRAFATPEVRDLVYVVAAHELLHIVYARLPAAERVTIDAELRAARAESDALERRLRVYAEVAEDTPNEEHAVLGTEFPSVSSTLETHYRHWIDRDRVVETYRRTLGERQDEIVRLRAAAEELATRLAALEAELDELRAVGDVRAFNARVGTYNSLVREHNQTVREVNARIEELEELTAA